MTFSDNAALAADSAFRIKVLNSIYRAALNVVGEAQAAMSADEHTKRQEFGVLVLNDVTAYERQFVEACAYLGTLTTASTDADVEFTVGSVWSDMAGFISPSV